jgi:hypothetical protein
MAVSTIFTETAEQVWVAKHRRNTDFFGSLEGLKDYLCNVKYHGMDTAWEETCEDSRKRPMRPCSKLLVCVSSIRYGGQYVGQVWRDTGIRVYREQ